MTSPPPPPPPPAPPAPSRPHQQPPPHLHGTPPRKLVRLTDQQKVAGVAAGLGWYLGVDPVMVRIGFVVATIATGIGIPAYILAWILLPAARSTSMDVPTAPKRKDGRSLALAGLAIVAALLLVGQIEVFSGEVLAAALLIGAGVLLFTDARPLRRGGAAVGAPWAGGRGVMGPGFGAAPPPGWASTPPPPPVVGRAPTAYSPYAGAWGPGSDAVMRHRRPRSFLGGLASAVWLAAIGLAALLDGIGAVEVTPVAVVALTVTVAGVALVIGTLFGRARGLILIGAAGTLLLIPLSFIPGDVPLDAGVGDRVETPRSVADVPAAYVLLAGSQTIDLTELADPPAEGEVVPVVVEQPFGELIIRVPDNVDVNVSGTMSFGQYEVLDATAEGPELVIDAFQDAGTSTDTGSIDIDLEMFAGDVTVESVGPR